MLKSYACALGLALLVPASAAAQMIEQVLVKVNGDILTKTEFEQRQVATLRTRPELANVTPESTALKRAVAEVTPELILNAVDELLLLQRGKELGLALGDEQFKTILENIKKSNNLDDDAKFEEALKQEGLTLADLRASLERQMLVSEVQRRDVVDKIAVTETEARAYYDANREQFTTPSEVTLREILIDVPATDRGVNVSDDDAAKAKAEDIRKRLLAGEPFPRLAAELSDAASKANGGLIGPLNHNELAPALQTVLSGLKVGDLTEVIRTTRGYQILKLESRTEPRVRTFEDARGDISNKIGEEKMRGERLKYLEKLRAQAVITWRNDELKNAYDQALAERRKALAG